MPRKTAQKATRRGGVRKKAAQRRPATAGRRSSTPDACIELRGVWQNNLKGFDLDLPLGKLVVVTGPSGSGKSSLAFETVYAEGQRRYVETFSPYTRQFFERMDKPQVDEVKGIPPAIAIEQGNAVRTTRSTVGTLTEINDYLKLLFPRLATAECPECGAAVKPDTAEAAVRHALEEHAGEPVLITFGVPVPPETKPSEFFGFLHSQGYLRILLYGELYRTDEPDAFRRKTLPAVVRVVQDRIQVSGGAKTRARLSEAIETAFALGKGKMSVVRASRGDGGRGEAPPACERSFARGWVCPSCDHRLREPSPGLFSFNNPLGACPGCRGFGRTLGIDLERALPDHSLSIADGAVKAFQGERGAECQDDLERCARKRGIDLDVPFGDLPKPDRDWVLYGERGDPEANWSKGLWYGVQGFFDWLESKAYKMHVRVFLSRYRSYTTCKTCRGSRLQPEALDFRLRDKTLPDLWQMPVSDLRAWFADIRGGTHAGRLHPDLPAGGTGRREAGDFDPTTSLVLGEIESRLAYLDRVGLSYLDLDRPARSLSGGELQRVHLTTCLGASLVNTLFVLDEPSIGLHPRDTGRLIEVMEDLRDAGNTVLVVEHEESVIRAADHLIDIGPGRGENGGSLAYEGPPPPRGPQGRPDEGHGGKGAPTKRAEKSPAPRFQPPAARPPGTSLTLAYLGGALEIPTPTHRRKPERGHSLHIRGASQNNLKRIDVEIPLGRFVCITGVSGSGKSTLVHDCLYRNLMRERGEATEEAPGRVGEIRGYDRVRDLVLVDQSPLSRTPRSTPVVYTGAFEHIRKLFAATPGAKSAGHKAGYFSFNSGSGRCGRCWGNGFEKVEMQFLSDLYVRCPECEGRRYTPAALEIELGGLSVHDILELTVDAAMGFFRSLGDKKADKVASILEPLADVGLGYLKLGQPLNTLSGGESQRLKLVGHLLQAKPRGRGRADLGGAGSADDREAGRTPPGTATDLLLFDEPTTGLHFDDIRMLLAVFQRLVDAGNSVVVIEHNTDVIKCADHVVDLGPEGGAAGGEVVGAGTPEEIAGLAGSHTGRYLAAAFGGGDGSPQGGDRPPGRKAPLVREPPTPHARRAIGVHGAREHNLKDITTQIPHDALTVVTGLSGSGKSTLAFDILFAEGQRRFLDSMSAYARQFVQQMEKPDVDAVTGLPPTVAIEQRVSRGGGKSTVATVTEIYHFLRLLFAKAGTQYCPDCGVAVEKQSATAIATAVRDLLRRGPLKLMAPLVKARKGFHTDVAAWAARQGIEELFVDGGFKETEGFQKLERFKEHTIDAVVADLEPGAKAKAIADAVATALRFGKGTARLLDANKKITVLSSEMSCPGCGVAFEELDPRLFSYNSPHGWCKACRGYGYVTGRSEPEFHHYDSIAAAELDEEMRRSRMDEDAKTTCPACDGARLGPVARSVWIEESTIASLGSLSVADARLAIGSFQFEGTKKVIARDILKEIEQRLLFLEKVGLGYLGLDRSATTLSGGESQRIRLAAQLGSNLRGVLYVLDEPTIGLHPRDNAALLDTLTALRDAGNSLVVVEHDDATIRRADHLLDLGPGAGREGGEVVFAGPPTTKAGRTNSATLKAIGDPAPHPLRGSRRKLPAASAKSGWIKVKGASANNLKKIDVAIPLGRLTVLTGISGSGKSSFMRGVLKPAVDAKLKRAGAGRAKSAASAKRAKGKKARRAAPYRSITGSNAITAVYEVDQSPIGKTSRSCPATYVKVFDEVRKLFANLPESRVRGFEASRFSFNTEGGRCETCGGNGRIKLEMNFLPTTWVDCDDCHGARYNEATLEVRYNDKTIADVMDMSIAEACDFFESHPKIHTTLQLLRDTGLGYLSLGQPSPTLSGGEAQRIKLIAEIRKGQTRARNAIMKGAKDAGGNLYLIEEPTIGLHLADVTNLVGVLHALVDEGHTVVVIEHNTDVMAEADYLIDIGPEAGVDGGTVVARGTPEQVATSKRSRTAPFLREALG